MNIMKTKLSKLVAIVLACLITVVGLPILAIAAENEAYGLQVTLDSSNKKISYEGFNWSSLGTNLIPDPTVANFDNGVYGKYATPDADYQPTNINTKYWWDKYIEKENGFTKYYQDMADGTFDKVLPDGSSYTNVMRSPANLNAPKAPNDATYKSLTDDGSGVLTVRSGGDWRYLPLPAMEANSYYVIKFNVKFDAELWADFGIKVDTKTFITKFTPGNKVANNKTDTVAFVVYTGSNTYSDPMIAMYLSNVRALLDDFGMYKVSEEYGKACAEGVKLQSLTAEPYGLQVTLDTSNKKISYTGFNWSSLGANLIPDPTVLNFDNGVYGKYATPDENFEPTNIDTRYWWDKYVDKTEGFTKYYKDMTDGTFDKKLPDGSAYTHILRSPSNMSMIKAPNDAEYKSLTEDGSGVLTTRSGGDWRYIPLPTMEANSYYVIKFNVKFDTALWSEDFGIKLSIADSFIAKFMPRNRVGDGTVDTVAFVVYTGAKQYNDPMIALYLSNVRVFFDDFGMYKVSDEYGAACAAGTKLVELAPALSDTPSVVQTVINTSNKKNDYSGFNWDLFGANAVTDPTVSHFDNGVYGKYAVPDSNFEPTNVNEYYWWDKYIDKTEGFTKYYQDMADGTLDKKLPDGSSYSYSLRSPANRSGTVKNSGSLTNDGTGVLTDTAANGGHRYYPLPKMEEYTYYLVKFNVKFKDANWSTDFSFCNDNTVIASQMFNMGKLSNTQNVVTFIVYTGNKNYLNPYIDIYLNAGNTIYLDDFGVYTLAYDYAELSMEEQKLLQMSYTDAAPNVAVTPNVDGYDFDYVDNSIEDGSFETAADATDYNDAKFGSKVLKIKDEKKISFKTDATSYYLISFWSKSVSGNAKLTASINQNKANAALISKEISLSTNWEKNTFILYTSYGTEFNLKLLADADVYVDGVAVIKLSETIALACYAMDTYVDGTYDPDRVDTAAEVFGVDNEFSKLVSPYHSSGSTIVTYKELYQKYLALCNELSRVEKGFAPSGYGSRENPKKITTTPDKSIIANGGCDDESFWKGANTVGSEYIEITNEYSVEGSAIKFTGTKTPDGTAAVYKMRITGLKANTIYYLRVQGMGLGDKISNADFGFMDTKYGKELENPLNEAKATTAAYKATFKQRNNFQCQDGTWYVRVYEFNTEKNTELDFFIRGTRGTVYYDNIMLFEQSDAYTIEGSGKIEDMAVLDYNEDAFACTTKDNLIENWDFSKGTEFWGDFNGMGDFVEVVTSENNKMLHFKGSDMAYYYLPWVEVKANVTYTFSYWRKNLNGEKSHSLLVSEYNPHGYASEVSKVSDNQGEWELVSVKFVCHEDNRVALGIYDRDGEAVFDKVRFFESSKGYATSLKSDMPKGGNTFTDSVLGSDGLAPKDDSETDGTDNEVDNESNEEQLEEIITIGRRPIIIKGKGFPVWGIVLICVGVAAVVVPAGIILTIFLLKKKKKK